MATPDATPGSPTPAAEPDEVDLPADLEPLFVLAGDDNADLWAVGLALAEQFTGLAVAESVVSQVGPFHPVDAR
ncbi:hypothetical protein [Nocardioides acrostichi]|uniref:Uncharacterized protein n=1 Tax=Nocardioides acrostichi TaxID=2784339 RepID=A0A930V0V6_9ACTN|nr:hypothetical protein [Nocardioides acrostichi]MBF4161655.1 hypothetical protein [Nocardioides acrostichi]